MKAKKEKLFFVINLILLLSLNLMILFEPLRVSHTATSNNLAFYTLVTFVAADLLLVYRTEQSKYPQYFMMAAYLVIYFLILEVTRSINPLYNLFSENILPQNTESFFTRLYFSVSIFRFLRYSNQCQATMTQFFRLAVFQYFIFHLYFKTDHRFTGMVFESLGFCAFVSIATLIIKKLPQIKIEKISIHKLEVE